MKQFFKSLLEELEGIYLCYHHSTMRQPSLSASVSIHKQSSLPALTDILEQGVMLRSQ